MKLRTWFELFTKQTGETVDYIRISKLDEYVADRHEWPRYDAGKVVPFNINDSIMNVEFNDSYGTQESPTVIAWSNSYVLFTEEYDGSEWLEWRHRNPTDIVCL